MTAAIAEMELDAELEQELDAFTAALDTVGVVEARETEDEESDPYRDLTKHLLDSRTMNVDGRKSSGIEDIWNYSEDAYLGIDDANRHEFHANRWMKPRHFGGGIEKGGTTTDGPQQASALFIPYTRRYTNAGVAKAQEILLAPDERPFGIKPTPVPELVQKLKDTRQVVLDGQPAFRDPTPKEVDPGSGGTPDNPLPLQTPPAQDTSQLPGKPLTYADLAKEEMDKARENVELLENRIHDDMVECNYARESRRVIFDGGRLGTGIMKGPFPKVVKSVVAYKRQGTNEVVVEARQKIQKTGECISPWDFYPDPGCGGDVNKGSSVWQKGDMSRATLQGLARQDGYDAQVIAQVLTEDPRRIDEDKTESLELPDQKALPYQAWFGYLAITKKDYVACQCKMNNPHELELDAMSELEDIHVQVTIVNDRVIHLLEQPNEKSGRFPYQLFNWLPREGSVFGVGIPEQGMPPQRIINSACRRLFDNVGFSAGLQIFIDTDIIEPVPVEGELNQWKLQAIKLWRKKKGSTAIDDIRKAMHTIKFENAQQQLSWLIEFGIRLFEEVTNIPVVTQGYSGKTTPETLGGQELQDSNANQMLRDVAMNYDHGVTVPYVVMCHEWDLLDENVPFEQKQDVKIFARGSTVMVDRYLQRQVFERYFDMLIKGGAMFGVDPKRVFEEAWRSYRLNPTSLQYTEAELEDLRKQPPPEPPEVTVAKIRAEIEQAKIKLQHDYNMKELDVRSQIMDKEIQVKLMDYATRERMSFQDAKTQLAKTTMELGVQERIADKTNKAKQVADEGTEVPGRAPTGQAFQL